MRAVPPTVAPTIALFRFPSTPRFGAEALAYRTQVGTSS
jgi:hypothetical protein